MAPSDANGIRGVRTVRRTDLVLGDQLGRGGQGTVHRVERGPAAASTFAVPAAPAPGIDGWEAVYKEYRPEVLPDLDPAALAAMVALQAAADAETGDARWLATTTAWPSAVVEESGAARGFLMRSVPDRFHFELRGLKSSGERRLANFEYLLNDDAYIGGVGLQVSDRDRIMLLHDLAGTLIRLHGMGIAVGDLSPKNLLFTTDPRPECFLIDCDAMRVRGASVLPQAETPDWQLPAGEERATAAGDAYKFALLAVRLFARSQTTLDPSALALTSSVLGDLAREGLSADPAARPDLERWADGLSPVIAIASTQATQITNLAAGSPTLRFTIGGNNGGQSQQSTAPSGVGGSTPLPPWYSPGSTGLPGQPGSGGGVGTTTGTPATPKNTGILAAAVAAGVLILIVVLALNNQSGNTPTPSPTTSSSDYSYDPYTTYTDPAPDPVTTSDSPTQDAMAQASVGDCFYDEGTSTTPDLVSTDCTTGAFEVVKVNDSTTDLSSCDGVTDEDEAVSSSADDLVLCLSYQNSGGDAFHAAQGDCVYGQSSTGSEWDVESCETGNFKVLATYRGTTDSSKCKNWPNYDEYRYYTVDSDSSMDVLLCLSMNYPDAVGNATQNECLEKGGTTTSPTFTNTGSCSTSNVYVTGRTSTYDDPSFCGNDGATWWENSDYPNLAYTVCWAWR